jgi:hypothetical protein
MVVFRLFVTVYVVENAPDPQCSCDFFSLCLSYRLVPPVRSDPSSSASLMLPQRELVVSDFLQWVDVALLFIADECYYRR